MLTSARLQKRLIFIKLETTFQPRIILKCLSKLLNDIQKEIIVIESATPILLFFCGLPPPAYRPQIVRLKLL